MDVPTYGSIAVSVIKQAVFKAQLSKTFSSTETAHKTTKRTDNHLSNIYNIKQKNLMYVMYVIKKFHQLFQY